MMFYQLSIRHRRFRGDSPRLSSLSLTKFSRSICRVTLPLASGFLKRCDRSPRGC